MCLNKDTKGMIAAIFVPAIPAPKRKHKKPNQSNGFCSDKK